MRGMPACATWYRANVTWSSNDDTDADDDDDGAGYSLIMILILTIGMGQTKTLNSSLDIILPGLLQTSRLSSGNA